MITVNVLSLIGIGVLLFASGITGIMGYFEKNDHKHRKGLYESSGGLFVLAVLGSLILIAHLADVDKEQTKYQHSQRGE